MSHVYAQEQSIRLGFFVGVLMVMLIWELASPRRRQEIPRLLRWTNNLIVVAIDSALVRLLFPMLAVSVAIKAQSNGWGLLNLVHLHPLLATVLAIVALDIIIYFQHIVLHAVPVLWRLHRMHHTDLEFDVTTGIRFHPAEIILSMGIKLLCVLLLGAPAIAVLLFEVLLNAASLFNHSNIKIPNKLEQLSRIVLVTPDMHRIHHSVYPDETNSNYGFTVPWWDKLFGTYKAQPRDGHINMDIGIAEFRQRRELWIDKMLLQPFRRKE